MGKLRNPSRLRDLRRLLRRDSTEPERKLWRYLRNSEIGYKFKRQYGISRYIPDFYCPALKLVVEVDGARHWEPAQHEYDNHRDRELRSLGCTVVRYPAREVLDDTAAVANDIQLRCRELVARIPSPKSSPR
jgi:very-short-patch-repair endonuclease